MKKMLLLALLCGLSMPVNANRLFLGGGGGSTSFDGAFGTGYQGHGKAMLVTDLGFALDLSSRYVVVKGNAETDPDIKMIPIMVGMHHFIAPLKARLSPYIGGAIGAAIMSQDFNSPAFIYGWKVGAIFNVRQDLAMYVEGETFYLEDAKQSLTIHPYFVSVGLLIKFGGKDLEVKDVGVRKQKKRRVYDRRKLDRRRYRKSDRRRN